MVLKCYSFQRSYRFKWVLLVTIMAGLLMGCGGDESESPVDQEVQKFLDQAKSAMDGIGVPISFESAEMLGNVNRFADPLELGVLEDVAAIESAIGALNDALNAGGFPGGGAIAAAPATAFQEGDKKLELIIHLNLSYLYMLAAVSRCVIDGGDIYTVTAADNPNTPEAEFYNLALKPVGEERLAKVKAKENPTAADFLGIFEPRQRQALINAMNLMEQVEASVEGLPEAGINAQKPNYNRSICLYSSTYHYRHAVNIVSFVGEQEVEATNLVGTVASQFFKGLREKAESWRFKIEDRPQQ